MVAAPPIAPERREVRLDDAGRLAEDLTCRSCGYNLRGLNPKIACPECSTPIDRSIHGDLLQFCDPAWVGRMGRGLQLIIIGLLVNVAYGIVVGSAIMLLTPTGTTMMTMTTALAGTIGAALSLITAIGVWMLTTADPGQAEAEQPLTARRLARWCILARVAAAPLELIVSPLGGMGLGTLGAPFTPRLMIPMVGLVALGMIALIGTAAGLIYLRQIALRIPRESLAKQTRTVMWGYVICSAVGVVFSVGMVLMMTQMMRTGAAPGAPGPGVSAFLFIILGGGCLAGIGTLVFGIWALVLLFLYAAALRRVAAEARSIWAARS
ncbi:MAG: hypothetical protein O6768_09140 [Planctomycetota bacterium]|nr:hypothetical protein [Planctomycetota bacterium]